MSHIFFTPQSVSPSGSDLNALGIYLLSSLVFVVAALLEFAVVIFINRITMTRKEVWENKLALEKGVCFSSHKTNCKKQVKFQNNIQPKKNPDVGGSRKETTELQQLETNWTLSLPFINRIDCIAFCVHIVLYFLFNVAYWGLYFSNESE